MNKGLHNEKLINFIIKNILILTLYLDGSFRWVLCSSLSKFSTVQKYFKFSTVQISKSLNSLLLFTDYTPHPQSTVHRPPSSCFPSFKAKQAAMSDNEERWESIPAEIPTHIESIIICTSFSKTWKSKSKTQLSFPPVSTTPTTKAKTSSSSGWQKKKGIFFYL